MGTPASVVGSPSASWQGPVPRSRKKASANIFKDINLLQIQTLFRTSGDECAEERARIICEYAEDKRVAEALIRLRRKKRGKRAHRPSRKASNDSIGTLSVQHFSKLCINEADHKGSTDTEDNNPDQPSSTVQEPQPCETKKETATTRRGKGKVRKETQERLSDYLHQIKR